MDVCAVAGRKSRMSKHKRKLIVLLGAPGAGKGTVAAGLRTRRGWRHLASGDLLRRAVQSGSPAGRAANDFMQRGELVPDNVIGRIIGEALQAPSEEFVVLDGYPRTPEQAGMLSDQAAKGGFCLLAAVMLDVSDETLEARLAGRMICEKCEAVYHVSTLPPRVPGICDTCGTQLTQRSDDHPDTVRRRLAVYRKKTAPLIAWYERSGHLRRIDGEGRADELTERVLAVIDGELTGEAPQ